VKRLFAFSDAIKSGGGSLSGKINIARLRVRQTATLFKKTHCWTNVR
jgi:hypothetical protein